MESYERMLSPQTLRMMRETIENSSQYSDAELTATGVILGSMFAGVQEVPAFLPMKEQVSYFTNMISCFMIGNLVNAGIVNPHSAPEYVKNTLEALKGIDKDVDDGNGSDEEETMIVGGKAVN